MEKNQSVPKTVRLNSNIIQKIESLAEKQNRNFSNMVETLLKELFEQKQEQEIKQVN